MPLFLQITSLLCYYYQYGQQIYRSRRCKVEAAAQGASTLSAGCGANHRDSAGHAQRPRTRQAGGKGLYPTQASGVVGRGAQRANEEGGTEVSKKRGNGEGSITKRKDGRWMARYTVYTANGPKRRHIYGRTRQEVAEKLSKAVSDRVGGLVFDGDYETLGAYLQRWIDEVVRGTVKQSTLENYA